MSKSDSVKSSTSFPGLSGWGTSSTKASSSKVRGRPQQRVDTTQTVPKRTHSADARPQYGRGSCLTLFTTNSKEEPVLSSHFQGKRVPGRGRPLQPLELAQQQQRQQPTTARHRPGNRASSPHHGRSSSSSSSAAPAANAVAASSIERYQSILDSIDQQPPLHDFDYLKNSLIMFGDAYSDHFSVYTGQSQQELLQKQERDEAVRRRKEKQFKKKRRDRIVNLPPSLTTRDDPYTPHGPTTSTPMQKFVCGPPSAIEGHQDGSFPSADRKASGKGHSYVNPSGRYGSTKKWNIIPTLAGTRSHSDDGGSTVMSSYCSEGPVGQMEALSRTSPSENANGLGWLQSTSNVGRMGDRAYKREEMPQKELFPLLSTNASEDFGEFIDSGKRRDTNRISHYASNGYKSQNEGTIGISPNPHVNARDTTAPLDDPKVDRVLRKIGDSESLSISQKSGRVRFAQHTTGGEPPTKSPAKASLAMSSPAKSSAGKASPTSVVNVNTTIRWSPSIEQPQISEQTRPVVPTQASGVGRPKSILRKGRSRSNSPPSDIQSQEVTEGPVIKSVRISTAPVTAGEFISSSPSAMGFLDTSGAEFSSIHSQSFSDYDSASLQGGDIDVPDWDSEEVGHLHTVGSESSQQTKQETFQEEAVEALVHGSSFNSLQDTSTSIIIHSVGSDIKEEIRHRDDDSTVISDTYDEFIEAVASVVLQTAIRRYLAKAQAKRLRLAKQAAVQEQERISAQQKMIPPKVKLFQNDMRFVRPAQPLRAVEVSHNRVTAWVAKKTPTSKPIPTKEQPQARIIPVEQSHKRTEETPKTDNNESANPQTVETKIESARKTDEEVLNSCQGRVKSLVQILQAESKTENKTQPPNRGRVKITVEQIGNRAVTKSCEPSKNDEPVSDNKAAIQVQAALRGLEQTDKPEVEQTCEPSGKNADYKAATKIQAAFRGWWARDSLTVEHYCATNIQRIFRGFVCRSDYEYDLFRIEMAQSAARRWLARRHFAERHGFRKSSTVETYHPNFDQANAATAIQAQWRSFASLMKFLRVYEDILFIQSVVRGWIARRKVDDLVQQRKGQATAFDSARDQFQTGVKPPESDSSIQEASNDWNQRPNQSTGPLTQQNFGNITGTPHGHFGSFWERTEPASRDSPVQPESHNEVTGREEQNHLHEASSCQRKPDKMEQSDQSGQMWQNKPTPLPLSRRPKQDPAAPDKAEALRKERIAYHRNPDSRSGKPRDLQETNSGSSDYDSKDDHTSLSSEGSVRNRRADRTTLNDLEQQSRGSEESVNSKSSSKQATTQLYRGQSKNGKNDLHFLSERSEEEQRRIDTMHEVFRRAGLMSYD